tara:strand:+ start:88 stop:711 length:624 start_codon:yes stop_codon:yes gene_type:complete
MIDVYDYSIVEIDDMMPKEKCKQIIQKFEKDSKKYPGRTIGGVNPKLKVSTDLAMIGSEWKNEFDCVMYVIESSMCEYMKRISKIDKTRKNNNIGELVNCIMHTDFTNPIIQKTSANVGFFNWHTDFNLDNDRILAIILYLNDVKEEDGGSTEFNSGRKIQPKIGKVLIFPADLLHLHKGNMLTNGSKYIVTSFAKLKDQDNQIFFI